MVGDGEGPGEVCRKDDREPGKSEGSERAEKLDNVRLEAGGAGRHIGGPLGGVGSNGGPPAGVVGGEERSTS